MALGGLQELWDPRGVPWAPWGVPGGRRVPGGSIGIPGGPLGIPGGSLGVPGEVLGDACVVFEGLQGGLVGFSSSTQEGPGTPGPPKRNSRV